ncbi:MAG: urease accessory protein UreD [Planktomarina sp.]|nr:urease accessory protein UreD [Planktomarina sp.]
MFIRNEAYVTAHIPIESIPTLQRARGLLNISTQKAYQTNTRLKNLRQEGSYRASFPRHSKGNIETVIINTAGGVTSGDKFTTTITAHENSQISITTQAAERIYRARDTLVGEIQTSLCLQKNAQLYWLPQETILFDGARLKRRLDVDLHSSAKFLMVEPLVFGREASGEKLLSGMLDDRVSISSNGQPIYIDRIKLKDNITDQLMRPALANNSHAVVSIVLVKPNAKLLLEPVRALLPQKAGASLLNDNILVVRMLAQDSHEMRTATFPILTLLTHNTVPKNWRL